MPTPIAKRLRDDWFIPPRDTGSLERILPRNCGTPANSGNSAYNKFGLTTDASQIVTNWHLQPITFGSDGGRITQITVINQGNDGTENGVNQGFALFDKHFNLLFSATAARTAGTNTIQNYPVDWKGVPQMAFLGLCAGKADGSIGGFGVMAHMVGSIIPGDVSYAFGSPVVFPSNPWICYTGTYNAPPSADAGDTFQKSGNVSTPFAQYVSWSQS